MKKASKMDFISVMMILFVGCVIMFCLLLNKYTVKETKDLSDLKTRILEIDAKIIKQSELINNNISSVANANAKSAGLREFINSVDDQVKLLNKKICDQQEKTISLSERISNKRPVVKFEQPIQFEVVKRGQGVKSLIKATK